MSFTRIPLRNPRMRVSKFIYATSVRSPCQSSWISFRGAATKSRLNDSKNGSFWPWTFGTSVLFGYVVYQQAFNWRQRKDRITHNDFVADVTTGSDRRLVPTNDFNLPALGVTPDLSIYDALEEEAHSLAECDYPEEVAVLTQAPYVPPTIKRDYAALLKVDLTTKPVERQLTSAYKYEQWTFNGTCPGPFIRARAGDVIEMNLTNKDPSGTPHNIDSHAFIGPGGGAALTTVSENETKTARFKVLYPGLYVYHCAAAPVPVHIANGMYGLIYVQPAEGDLPKVDREYYVMQSEFYHESPEIDDKTGKRMRKVEFSYPNALREEPEVVCFNGSESALTRDSPLKANLGETVRIFFGNAGPNLTSAFHVIGSNFKSVYRDGDVVNPPANFVATVPVPPGAATITDMKMVVPGTYTLVDHALFRLDKGAAGFLNVSGKARPDIYQSPEHPAPCVGCKLHS